MNKRNILFGSGKDHSARGHPPPQEDRGSTPPPQSSATSTQGLTRKARFVPIFAPHPCEAIGRALGSAYSAASQAILPDDMQMLLQKLDGVPARSGDE